MCLNPSLIALKECSICLSKEIVKTRIEDRMHSIPFHCFPLTLFNFLSIAICLSTPPNLIIQGLLYNQFCFVHGIRKIIYMYVITQLLSPLYIRYQLWHFNRAQILQKEIGSHRNFNSYISESERGTEVLIKENMP